MNKSVKSRVAVYGTLKKGKSNHDALSTAKFIGGCYVTGKYRMFDLGAYPCVTKGGKDKSRVYAEVYEVDSETLSVLDCIEGHPDYYTRTKVRTPWKGAWMYFLPASYASEGFEEVDSGCWRPSDEESKFFASDEVSYDAVG